MSAVLKPFDILKHIQLWPFANGMLLNKAYENVVTLKGENIPLKNAELLKF